MNVPMASQSRGRDTSPVSVGSDSAWDGMAGYNNTNLRSDGPYAAAMPHIRNDSMPPPPPDVQGRMNGSQNMGGGFGPPGFGPPQRRRPSEAGSQPSSRAASVAHSRSSDGTISDQQSRRYRRMEVELQQHYTILRAFLRAGSAQQPPRPNKARDKLLRLSPGQFHELSTDVFDELQRRQAAAPLPGREPRQKNVPPFLQPIPQFHEKRNQARQKLSSLQASRFRDLSTDVFCELERRFPYFANPEQRRRDSSRSVASRNGRPPLPPVHTANGSMSVPNNYPPRSGSMASGSPSDNPPGSAGLPGDFGRPLPKQFQSNTITPNKSTMVEDDEDEEGSSTSPNYRRGRSNDGFDFESVVTSPTSDRGLHASSRMMSTGDKAHQQRIAALESTLQQKDDEMRTLKLDLDKKVQDAGRVNKSLQDELDRVQVEQANMERDLRSQIQASQKDSGDVHWKDQHDQLQREHEMLQTQFYEQQRITEEVSRQGEMFLSEMRAMAEGGGGNFEREEKLQLKVHKLEEELKEWKARYARAKSQLRSAKTASSGVGFMVPNAVRAVRDDAFHSPHGLIKDVHISQFQISIDELLQTARSTEPTAVLVAVKDVVMAVRNVTLDIDSATVDDKDEETTQRRTKLRSKISATANNVITASKSFATADGLSPVSLLDAAASHLTAAVVDLVRLVKIRPIPPEDDTDEDGFVKIQNAVDPVNDAGYFNMTQRLRKSSVAESEYSALSSPSNGVDGPGQSTDTPATSHSIHGNQTNGLGIQTGVDLGEDDTELQELKIYLDNQTDLLAQTIQSFVMAIRKEESMPSINSNVSAIVDIVENVISAAEGAMEDPSSYQAELRQKVGDAVRTLTKNKDELLRAGSLYRSNTDSASMKAYAKELPPLAFRIARETKELVSRIESVEAKRLDDDFS